MAWIERLRMRADMLSRARAFFAERGVMEVDTPVLGEGLVVESHVDPIPCRVQHGAQGEVVRHLLTSPEGPMKRLLAAGSGPIYQFAKAFRDGELGRRHLIEFTMLEWYRPGLDHFELMDEVEALVRTLVPRIGAEPFERVSYRQLFVETAQLDPHATSLAEIRSACERLGVAVPDSFERGTLDDALDLLLVSHIEPQLGTNRPVFVHAYPPSQAALARVRTDADAVSQAAADAATADRFELYFEGVELTNGYYELADASEQRLRFEQANRDRQTAGRPPLPLDEELLQAMAAGFPDCAGVALGFDRLVMLALGCTDIADARAPQ
ncbi:MAG: EF-P lysine aminoacylase EpmA [Planctomycetota bacterium]